jgi:hypothetical protein
VTEMAANVGALKDNVFNIDERLCGVEARRDGG